jgi:hypothetical protein
VLNLNYSGTAVISALKVGGTNMNPGVYGSAASPATYQGSHFSGTGTVTVPSKIVISGAPATAITSSGASLNATLACSGTDAAVYAYWNTANGGTNAALWTNSAYVGAWTNIASTSLSYTATGLASGTSYYFTFRGTNALGSVWAANGQSFTTLALPPTPVLPPSGVVVANGVASFNFTAAAGCKYRLQYKNELTDAVWMYGSWSTDMSGSLLLMTLIDQSANGQPQRFYRLEAAYP